MPGWASRCVTPCGPSQPRCGMGSIRAKNIVLSRLANMLEFTVIPEVRAWSRAQRAAGRRVGVVPTMGYLHDGHLALVRRMVRDLNWPIEIIGVPTVREPDGLALSSRNAYLDAAGRQRAVVLSRALQAAHQAYCRGQRRAADLEQLMRDQLSLEPQVQV